MTRLKRNVARETAGAVYECGRHRPVIVTLSAPNVLSFRLKGTRRAYALTAEACYMLALKAAQESAKRDKAKRSRRRAVKRGIV